MSKITLSEALELVPVSTIASLDNFGNVVCRSRFIELPQFHGHWTLVAPLGLLLLMHLKLPFSVSYVPIRKLNENQQALENTT